mmetsp:Transcript_24449/g.70150  ORF Transcript_24449/g.70150 Transcript_24449/m.70150 type:complete len:177 (+) Transcript_24449:21-551(+)
MSLLRVLAFRRMPRSAGRAGPTLSRCFSQAFESEDLETSRHTVFGAAKEDSSVFQSTTHAYRPMEPTWREHNLGLFERTRASSAEALRKKLRHHARARGWMEAAEFLVAFVDERGASLEAEELQDWERLMACDDMFLMRLVAGLTATPQELDTSVLQKLQDFFASRGPGSSPSVTV